MDNKPKGKLYLIPTPLADQTLDKMLTPMLCEVIQELSYFLVENVRTSRRFISSLKLGISIEDLQFQLLDKNTKQDQIHDLCRPIFDGVDMGIMSEAGCPGVADPGNLAVRFAHKNDIEVVSMVGPSSILMALMASGFNGQHFVFHGYLPIDKQKRAHAIKSLEREAYQKKQTQVFMETPYRNNQLVSDILKVCQPNTSLCIAKNITGSNEEIRTKTIVQWRKHKVDLHKVPTVFLIYSE